MGAADIEGRLAASVGELDAEAPDFSPALDVPNGGVLCALPALLAVGLLADIERYLELPKGTTDYRVSAMDGQPFVVINQVVGPGLIQVFEEQIVPQLDERVPAQPDAEQLEADPRRHRLTLVFDREGYSPGPG